MCCSYSTAAATGGGQDSPHPAAVPATAATDAAEPPETAATSRPAATAAAAPHAETQPGQYQASLTWQHFTIELSLPDDS